MSKKPLKEGVFDRFVDAFFDSYKKGLDKQFIEKSKQRNPELAKKLAAVTKSLDDIAKGKY